MFGTVLLIAAAQSAAAQPVVRADDLGALFVAACLDGEARLGRSDARPVAFRDVPKRLRGYLRNPASAKVWQLQSDRSAFLYVLEYPGDKRNPKICGVASQDLDLDRAAGPLQMRLLGRTEPRTMAVTEYWRPQDGFVAMVTSAGGYDILQINFLSEEQRAEALRRR